MPSLQLSTRAPDPARELDTILESIGWLRDYVRAKGLAPNHPHVQEIEDIWWRTKRFIERFDAQTDTEAPLAPDPAELYRLFHR